MNETLTREEIRSKIDALNAEAAANFQDPNWRRAVAAEITETIYEGFTHENLLDLMTDYKVAGFTDREFIKEVRGLKAFWVARGGYIETSTLNQDVMELPRETVGIAVEEFEDKLISNFAETQSTLTDLATQRLYSEVNARFLKLIQAAIGVGHDSYISAAGVSLTALNTALREVRDESRTNEVAIVGRSTMIDQIYDQIVGTNAAGFLPNTNEELIRQGRVGVYRGAQLITLTNWKDGDDVPYFPANELYVIGRDASKFVTWGPPISKEQLDFDGNWRWKMRLDVGGVVHRPERARRIVDISQPS